MNMTTLALVEIEEEIIDPWAFACGMSPRRPGWYAEDSRGELVLGPFTTAQEAGEAARVWLDRAP